MKGFCVEACGKENVEDLGVGGRIIQKKSSSRKTGLN
jgi:hypothetical protein